MVTVDIETTHHTFRGIEGDFGYSNLTIQYTIYSKQYGYRVRDLTVCVEGASRFHVGDNKLELLLHLTD